MNNRTPLVVSIVAHVILLLLSFCNMDGLFTPKIKDRGYAVFDFVEIGSKSKAPILSDKEGRVSKTKARTPEKETVNQENQPVESMKSENKEKPIEKKNDKMEVKTRKDDEKAVSLNKKKTKLLKKETQKKSSKNTKAKKASKTNEKAVVNLRKNKKKLAPDTKAAKKSFDSLLDDAMASKDNENSGIKAEEAGETLTATQIDLIRQTIRKCWHFPAGLRNAEDLVVDIKMELDQAGNVTKAEIVDLNRMASDADFRTAAENAYRAVLDPNCNPLPLPKEKYDEWKELELSFNPKDMFE
ncbi:MAG: hypothetical protein IJ599_04720 [Alphaproteobacteria bacterium]|nr:hypothetical protein [Alphaproteobacteria bacterium]